MSVKLYLFGLSSMLVMSVFSECRKKEIMNPTPQNNEISTPTTSISYLALGDSYTKAECETVTNSYPSKLTVRLKENGINVSSQLTIAQTGWRTDNLKNAINSASLKDTFDLVSLLIGVNNQFQGKPIQYYRKEFRELLEMAIYYAKGRKDKVFVLSIPDYGVTPFGSSNEVYISQQIDLFNAVNKEVSDSLGIQYFDITPISRNAKTDAELLCTDNLHPSAKMYEQWVTLIFPNVLQIARNP